jgi:hypothetical protein
MQVILVAPLAGCRARRACGDTDYRFVTTTVLSLTRQWTGRLPTGLTFDGGSIECADRTGKAGNRKPAA